MAIDLRQPGVEDQRPLIGRPKPKPRWGLIGSVLLALVAVVVVGAAAWMVAFQEEPLAGSARTDVERLFTQEREGGGYASVPTVSVDYRDPMTSIRESGPYATQTGSDYRDPMTSIRESGPYATQTGSDYREAPATAVATWDPQKLEAMAGRLLAG
jgi:hypothetical protein